MGAGRSISTRITVAVVLVWLIPAGADAGSRTNRRTREAQRGQIAVGREKGHSRLAARVEPAMTGSPVRKVIGAGIRGSEGRARGKARAVAGGDGVALVRGARDPFAPLISDTAKSGKAKAEVRPAGRAGLMIGEIAVQGTVEGPHGAVAVVSNPQGRVYFLRAGDKVFDGKVERVEWNGVQFIEESRDAFGRAYEHRVFRAVPSSAGAKP